ncbi:MAG: insulinase family protein [Planctomycetes bacterium]|nr:insulinase family protein [Planctomycetota bacterium]
MKTRRAEHSLGLILLLWAILFCSMSAVGQSYTKLAYGEHGDHSGRAQALSPGLLSSEPQSVGARIISEFKHKPIEFTPPEPKRIVMDNGMIIYLLEDHDLPIFRITAQVRTGAVYESDEKVGLANLVGSVMRRGGTKTRPPDQINEELEFIAASVETSIGRESGSASLSVMKKDIDKGLEIFADVLMNPAFPPDMIRKEKDEILESIRRENDRPGQIIFREFRKLIYEPNHPYSRKTDGYPDTIEKITREDMVAFHKRYFHPNNFIIGVSGDFDTDEILRKLKYVFRKWEKEEVTFPKLPPIERQFEKSINYIYKDVTQAHVVAGHLGISRLNKDYFPIKIMNFILGSGAFVARIPSKVRSDEGLAYSAYSYFFTPKDLGFFFVSCQTKSESTVKAITLALEEVEKVREELVDVDELELAKDTYINQFIFKFTSSASIVGQMVGLEYEGLPLNYLETYVDNIKAVTREDVLRVAKEHLHPDKMKLLIIGDMDQFDKNLGELGDVNTIELKKN